MRVEARYYSPLAQERLYKCCDRCGVSVWRRLTMFEEISMRTAAGFYGAVLTAADLRSLAPDPGSCVFCSHPWSWHGGGVCSGAVLQRTAVDQSDYFPCSCRRTPQ